MPFVSEVEPLTPRLLQTELSRSGTWQIRAGGVQAVEEEEEREEEEEEGGQGAGEQEEEGFVERFGGYGFSLECFFLQSSGRK